MTVFDSAAARPKPQFTAQSDTKAPSFAQRTESTREREVFGYLRPWADTYHPHAFPRPSFSRDTNLPNVKPSGCEDTALAAFAQLGATRMNVRRCMISLISTSIEYCLAESTKTLSLQFDSVEFDEDSLWLGTSSFQRNEGINENAMQMWRKAKSPRDRPPSLQHYYTEGRSPHWYIISDVPFSQDLENLPYVKGATQLPLRFYCSIPIRNQNGSVMGSLTIMDDKPRYGVSAMEMNFMEDMGQTIIKHLAAIKAGVQRHRGERLIQGLGLFNSGGDSLREWWLNQDKAHSHRGRGETKTTADEDALRSERADHEFGSSSTPRDFERARSSSPNADALQLDTDTANTTRANGAAANTRDSMHVQSRDFVPPAKDLAEQQGQESKKTTSAKVRKEGEPVPRIRKSVGNGDFHLANEIDDAYARASNLIREALGADGAMFVDVNVGPPSKRDKSPVRDTSESRFTSTSESDPAAVLGEGAKDKDGCSLLGFSTRVKSSLRGFLPSKNHLSLSKVFIERLVKKYPHGKIFNFDERGAAYSSSGEEGTSGQDTKAFAAELVKKVKLARSRNAREAAALSDIFSGVQSVAFLPLWDSNSQRFRAGALVWTNTPLRYFDPGEDLTYLSAFGNSVNVELSRLESFAADRAKTTFISSVSHELRSPLHGILGGLELLQTTNMDNFQNEMMGTVKMAAMTLLDTVSDILDFVKIENLTKKQRKELAKDDLDRKSTNALGRSEDPEQTIDLAKLTEDVIETIVVGRRFQRLAKTPSVVDESKTQPFFPFTPTSNDAVFQTVQEDVSIILNIDWQPTWRVKLLPGQWTRIITNLVGNALKYTKRGSIRVKLYTEDDIQTREGTQTVPITLTVEDTGIGMSKDYLDHYVYTPFMQENAHSEGTGLGLSIVQQILMTMNGEMNIQSILHQGTKVKVTFLADVTGLVQRDDAAAIEMEVASELLTNKRLVLLTPPRLSELSEHHSTFTEGFVKTCSEWFSLQCSFSSHIDDDAPADIYAYVQSTVNTHEVEVPIEPDIIANAVDSGRLPLVVLAPFIDQSTETRLRRTFGNDVVYVDQPVGPHKLARILTALLTATTKLEMTPNPNTSEFVTRPRRAPSHSFKNSISSDNPGDLDNASLSPVTPISDMPEETSRRPPSRHPAGVWSQPLLANVLNKSTSASDKRSSIDSFFAQQGSGGAPGTYVLLVEDNPINMKLLMVLMRKMNLRCQSAENGAIAVQMYISAPEAVSLILMDMSMPVMDGFKATEEIRAYERRKNLRRSNITALTGVTSAEARRNAFASGVDRFLAKPVSMKQIEELVDDLLLRSD